ncbi:MAG: DUF1073 domain-containing protein [Pseudomonadota bacterium]
MSRALARGGPIGEPKVAGDAAPRTASVPRMYDIDLGRAVDTLKNLTAAIGTRRDKRTHSFYDLPNTLTRVELENMFRSSWVAKRIVRTPADDMTRAWVELSWDDSDEDEASTRAVAVAEKTFGLRQLVNEAISWGRLYGGAGIIFDIKGQEDWSLPLDLSTVGKGMLRSLHVLDRWRLAATGELDYDRRSSNYGYPMFYTISDQGDPRFRVHWSRIVRFGGEPLPYFLLTQNAYWPDSVLQHVSDVIRDYDATMAGIASLVYEANVDIITSPKLANTLAEKNGMQKIADRYLLMAQTKSINHMMLLDGGNGTKDSVGETYAQKTTAFTGLKDVAEKFMINVSGAADIPLTRLFGQSPAGLTATGESDIRNYYDRVSADQESKLRPALERIYEVLVRSTLGNMPENFAMFFKPLWQMSDKEAAEIEKFRAERDKMYVEMGSVPEHVVTGELLEQETYRNLTQEDVDLVKKAEAAADLAEQAAAKAFAKSGGAPGMAPGGKGGPPGAGAPPAKPGDPKAAPAADAAVGARDVIEKEAGGWMVYSEGAGSERKKLGGPYPTKAGAVKRLAQVEYFKNA